MVPDVMDALGVEQIRGEAAAGAEMDPPQNVDVVISSEVPRVQVPVRNAVGKILRYRNVIDKSVIFAMPAGVLRQRAHIFTRKPGLDGTGGKVLVTDATGQLLARFRDEPQACKHLKAAGVEPARLLGFKRKGEKAAKGK